MVVHRFADMKFYDVIGCFDPIDVRHAQVQHAVSGLHGKTFGSGRCQAIEDFGQRAASAGCRSRPDDFQDPIYSAVESRPMHRLQHVVECVDLERVDRMLVVGSYKHDWWHAIRSHGAHDTESVQLRHLHIEEHEVGAECLDALDGGETIAALADDLDVTPVLEERAQVSAGDRLVVHHERSNTGGNHRAAASRGQRGSV